MARVYVVSAGGITVAGATTLVFINPGTTAGIELRKVWVEQSATATLAQQRLQFVTQVSTFPTLTSKTPTKVRQSDAASVITGGTAGAAGTSGVNASAEGAGAKTVIREHAFNNVYGFLWQPGADDERIVLPPGGSSGFGLYFPTVPGTLTNWAFGVEFAELA